MDGTDSALSSPPRRPGRLALPVALLAVLGGTAWWATHPDVFDDAGGFGMTTVPEPVGQTYYAGIVSTSITDERRELELRSATPVVHSDSAGADIEVYVCEVDPTQDAVGVGTQRKEPTDVCLTFEPAAEGTLLLTGGDAPRHELVLAVTATRPGVVEVRGVEVSYRTGLRRGTEVTGGHLTYRAR